MNLLQATVLLQEWCHTILAQEDYLQFKLSLGNSESKKETLSQNDKNKLLETNNNTKKTTW